MSVSVTIDGVARLEGFISSFTCWNTEKINVIMKVNFSMSNTSCEIGTRI